jgi:hypothetical protein
MDRLTVTQAATATAAWLREAWPWLLILAIAAALFAVRSQLGRRIVLWVAGIIIAVLLLIGFLWGGGAVWIWAQLSAAWQWYFFETVSPTGTSTQHPHADLINPIGTFIGALGAFLAAAMLAWAAVRNARAATRQAKTASDRHDAQTEADRQRRITESYSKAVEQLSSDKIEQRLGGIYTLERISQESPNDYWTIMETLTAFIRERARWQGSTVDASETMARFYESDKPINKGPPTDIAAVLTVIGRRSKKMREREERKGWWVNLSGADLSRATLSGATLSHADLSGADLSHAELTGATLFGATLIDADLSHAELTGAKGLTQAQLDQACGENVKGLDKLDPPLT